MATKEKELFNEDGEDLKVGATVNLEDSNRPGQPHDALKTPGVFVMFTGHFKDLGRYLSKIFWR